MVPVRKNRPLRKFWPSEEVADFAVKIRGLLGATAPVMLPAQVARRRPDSSKNLLMNANVCSHSFCDVLIYVVEDGFSSDTAQTH
jgi:hypothetical protein